MWAFFLYINFLTCSFAARSTSHPAISRFLVIVVFLRCPLLASAHRQHCFLCLMVYQHHLEKTWYLHKVHTLWTTTILQDSYSTVSLLSLKNRQTAVRVLKQQHSICQQPSPLYLLTTFPSKKEEKSFFTWFEITSTKTLTFKLFNRNK